MRSVDVINLGAELLLLLFFGYTPPLEERHHMTSELLHKNCFQELAGNMCHLVLAALEITGKSGIAPTICVFSFCSNFVVIEDSNGNSPSSECGFMSFYISRTNPQNS